MKASSDPAKRPSASQSDPEKSHAHPGQKSDDAQHGKSKEKGKQEAGATEQEHPDSKTAARKVAKEASSSQTAAGASAPLSKPALESAPKGEDGPLVSEADPTSNTG